MTRAVSVAQNATNGLRDALDELRPWSNSRSVEAVLRAWAQSRYTRPIDWLGLADVAGGLKQLGTRSPLPDAEAVASMAAFSIANVAAGRRPEDCDLLRQSFPDAPTVTAYDYRSRYSEADGSAMMAYFARASRRDDIAWLVRGGRSEAAARRWLQRNPGKHWPAAPAPRRARNLLPISHASEPEPF